MCSYRQGDATGTDLDSILETMSSEEEQEQAQKVTENSKDEDKNLFSSLEDYNLLADLDVSS